MGSGVGGMMNRNGLSVGLYRGLELAWIPLSRYHGRARSARSKHRLGTAPLHKMYTLGIARPAAQLVSTTYQQDRASIPTEIATHCKKTRNSVGRSCDNAPVISLPPALRRHLLVGAPALNDHRPATFLIDLHLGARRAPSQPAAPFIPALRGGD